METAIGPSAARKPIVIDHRDGRRRLSPARFDIALRRIQATARVGIRLHLAFEAGEPPVAFHHVRAAREHVVALTAEANPVLRDART